MEEKFDPLVAEWFAFVKNPNFNLVEKCLKFAQILEYPDLNVDDYIKKIRYVGFLTSLIDSFRDIPILLIFLM